MNVPVLANPISEHFHKVEEVVDLLNHIQKYFRLSIIQANWLPNSDREVNAEKLRAQVEKRYTDETVIAVINPPFTDHWFSHDHRRSSMITMSHWEELFAPPPLKVYLAYEFAQALINFAADTPDPMIKTWLHKEPIGCLFDFFKAKKKIRLGMVGANLCGDCEAKFSGMGLPDQALESVEQILAYVRNATIRRPRATPSYIFIGHGRSDDWLELKSFLAEELGLQIEEFNREAVAGLATTERLQEMLSRACFAFLVMTAEDEHADDKRHARENVVHEIGLFQGRLGFRKAIILKENKCAEFSNIHGLTYIPFRKGRLSDTKDEIKRTLEREGIIEPILENKSTSARRKNSRVIKRKAKA